MTVAVLEFSPYFDHMDAAKASPEKEDDVASIGQMYTNMMSKDERPFLLQMAQPHMEMTLNELSGLRRNVRAKCKNTEIRHHSQTMNSLSELLVAQAT